MISAKQNDDEFLVELVKFLSTMKYPHDVDGGFSIAERYGQEVSDAVRNIERRLSPINLNSISSFILFISDFFLKSKFEKKN